MINIIESMKYQPIENIGMVGHVADGKSTIVQKITQKVTQQHSAEKKQNVTIRLGYANAKIFKCPVCPNPECYKSSPSSMTMLLCPDCNDDVECELVRHVSFVDCPGHNLFTSTMLNGTSIMDTTILVEACNNPEIPAPQTKEHLMALKISNLPNIVVCVNKLDLMNQQKASHILTKFRDDLQDTSVEHSDILPMSANFDVNIDLLLKYIAERPLPTIEDKQINKKFKMIIIRSFNSNKINEKYDEIKGGVIGGSVTQGTLNIGDKILIKPGHAKKNPDYDATNLETKRYICVPFKTTILSINSDKTDMTTAISGGLIGVGTTIDPSFVVNDMMVGNVAVSLDNTDEIYEDIKIKYNNMSSIKINKKDIVIVNHNACNNNATVRGMSKDGTIILSLNNKPLCANIGDKITISKKSNENTFVIIGNGEIIDGNSSIVSI
jgi:translation initiation factor 2 subunit 3